MEYGRKKLITAGDPIAVIPLIRVRGGIRLNVELAVVDVPVRDPELVHYIVYDTAI